MTSEWEMAGVDRAVEMAIETGRPVIWAEDGTLGFARPLADGETVAAALADFDAPYVRDGYHGHERYEVFEPEAKREARDAE